MILFIKKESYKILGACFEVYKQKGCGFSEAVYQECLAIEFELQKIPFVEQPKIQLEYKGRILNQYFQPEVRYNFCLRLQYMQDIIIKTTGFTLIGIMGVAIISYTYFNLMFTDLVEADSFENAQIPHYL